ncbi:hypothetical protein CYMTET_50683 [Cymbomonas tetramitiformis]|uniref:Uncharacterized protein n=1 Tax=Cymbomonas tetramitiformis TaxID=36881 RepID=A0AAE0ESK0_9CHLO|nr:hypothetical protein CYMTET_50683 [Cymbomonas tetramitiformis]
MTFTFQRSRKPFAYIEKKGKGEAGSNINEQHILLTASFLIEADTLHEAWEYQVPNYKIRDTGKAAAQSTEHGTWTVKAQSTKDGHTKNKAHNTEHRQSEHRAQCAKHGQPEHKAQSTEYRA